MFPIISLFSPYDIPPSLREKKIYTINKIESNHNTSTNSTVKQKYYTKIISEQIKFLNNYLDGGHNPALLSVAWSRCAENSIVCIWNLCIISFHSLYILNDNLCLLALRLLASRFFLLTFAPSNRGRFWVRTIAYLCYFYAFSQNRRQWRRRWSCWLGWWCCDCLFRIKV